MDNAARWENPTKISDPTLYHWRCERRWAARDRRLDRLVLRCLSTAAAIRPAAVLRHRSRPDGRGALPGPAGRLIPEHTRLMMASWGLAETPHSRGVAGTRRLQGRSPPR